MLVMSGKSIKHKKGAGPPTVTSHKQSLIRTLKTFPKMSIRKLRSNLAYKYQDAPSNSTVFRFILKAGFSFEKPVTGLFITNVIAKRRVAWCKEQKLKDWEFVFFTDEYSVWLNRHRLRCGLKEMKIQFHRYPVMYRNFTFGVVFLLEELLY